MRRNKSVWFIIFSAIIALLVGPAITAALFMLLWNWLVPIFWASAPIINFWAALGVTILLNLVFGRTVIHTK